jgi:predicted DCC family thiol-disulfide oxidoreductase YuxK
MFYASILGISLTLVCHVLSLQTTTTSIRNVVLYDGVCNLCNGWVDLLLRLDSKKTFKFSALQSPKGKNILKAIGRDENDISSVVLVKTLNRFYFKSDVPIEVLKELKGLYFILGSLLGIFPFSFRNQLYDIVAQNRYNILGKRSECRCGDANFKDRFE